jgi:glutaredoxin
MNFEKPTPIGFTIYTKSGCPYCIQAKELLQYETPEPKIIDCDSYLKEDRDSFLLFIHTLSNTNHRTFPMIFKNGDFLGGFTETKEFQAKQCVNWNVIEFS